MEKGKEDKEVFAGLGNKIQVLGEDGKMTEIEIDIHSRKEQEDYPKGFPIKLIIPFKPNHIELCHKDKKRKCVECDNFFKLRATNPFHKTAYCEIGKKSVNIVSDKSRACAKIKVVKFLLKDLI